MSNSRVPKLCLVNSCWLLILNVTTVTVEANRHCCGTTVCIYNVTVKTEIGKTVIILNALF